MEDKAYCKIKYLLFMTFIFLIYCRGMTKELVTSEIASLSSLEQSSSKKGRFVIEVEGENMPQTTEWEIRLNPKLNQPKTHSRMIAFLIFFPELERTIKEGFYSVGYLKTSKSYSFDLPEGEYFASIDGADLLPASYGTGHVVPFLYNDIPEVYISFGYENKNIKYRNLISNDGFVEFQGIECQSYFPELKNDKYWVCPKLVIKEGTEQKIKLKFGNKKISYLGSLFMYVPGLLFLAPPFLGSVVFKRDVNVFFVNNSDLNKQ